MKHHHCAARQGGATLLIALIMLVLMTLLAVSSFNLGKSNLQIVGNMQTKAETSDSAKAAVEEVISKTTFTTTPSAALGASNSKTYDVNGDGAADVTVTLTPAPCIKKAQIVKNSQLDLSKATDLGCSSGVTQNLGISGAATGDSLCADTTWEITAVATDSVSSASSTNVQGVAVRVAADSGINTALYCP